MLKNGQKLLETHVRMIPWILNSIVVITLCLSLWVAIKPLYNAAVRRETAQAVSAKLGLESDLSNVLYRMSIAAVLTAQDPEMPGLLHKAVKSQSEEDLGSVLTKLQSYRKNARLAFIEVVGTDGVVLANTGIAGRRKSNVKDWSVFKNTTETQNASTLSVIGDKAFATSSALVRYEGQPVGIVVAGFELDYKWLARKSKDLTSKLSLSIDGKTTISTLADESGNPILEYAGIEEGSIATVDNKRYAVAVYNMEEAGQEKDQKVLGTITVFNSLEGFFTSLAQIARNAALVLAPLALFSFFVILQIGQGMVIFTIKLARLKSKLEKILKGTKELATTREKLSASGLATRYVIQEFSDKGKGSATIFLLSPPVAKKEDVQIEDHSIFRALLVQNGELVDEPDLEPVEFSEVSYIKEALLRGKACLDSNKKLYVPVMMGQKPLGVMEVGPLASVSHITAEDADFANALASSLAISLENISFVSESQEKAKLDAELEAAKTVQEALLPRHNDFPGVDIASTFQSASQTGGDWFGFTYDAHTNKLLFYIGDVTGHGFPSALLTGVVCGAIYSSEYTSQSLIKSMPADGGAEANDDRMMIMARTLNQVVRQTGRNRLLMTMIFMSLDLKTGEVQYLNAGHNAPYWIQAKDKKVKAVPSIGSRLGFTNSPTFTIKKFKMEPGDAVFLFTDGLIENTGPTGALFTEKMLKNILAQEQSVEEMLSVIISQAKGIWADNPPADDCTSLVFRWEGPIERETILEKTGGEHEKIHFHHVPDLGEDQKK